jgi:hypothetical protein
MVKVISTRTIACKKILFETFKTHPTLSPENIEFVSGYLCSLDPNVEQLTNFVLHTLQSTNTGRFSFLFNDYVDIAIKDKNTELLKNLFYIANPFYELHNNPMLNEMEKRSIQRMVDKERQSLKKVISKAEELIAVGRLSLDVVPVCKDNIILGKEKISLYSKCYQEGNPFIPYNIYVRDDGTLYKFPYVEIVKIISKDNPINPSSGKPFSPEALNVLYRKLEKEVKMYVRYQQLLVLNK